jgi:hypothetical protein
MAHKGLVEEWLIWRQRPEIFFNKRKKTEPAKGFGAGRADAARASGFPGKR